MWEDFDPGDDKRLEGASTVRATYQEFTTMIQSSFRLNVVFGLDPPVEDAATLFPGMRWLGGDLCRVYGRFSSASLPQSPEHSSLTGVPGTLFVYKADRFIERFCPHITRPRLPVIHRPKGFGKTSFLSAVAGYFDALSYFDTSPVASSYPTLQPPFPVSRYTDALPPERILAFRLDFADLARSIEPDSSYEAVRTVCRSYLRREIYSFYNKHVSLFQRVFTTKGYETHHGTFRGLKGLLKKAGYRVFLGVDNYTAPGTDVRGIERFWACDEMWRQFMEPALHELGGVVWSGLLIGCTGYPFVREPLFGKMTEDLSPIVDYVGFSSDDLAHLGRAALGTDRPNLTVAADVALISAGSATAMISQLINNRTTGTDTGSIAPLDVVFMRPTVISSGRSVSSLHGPPTPLPAFGSLVLTSGGLRRTNRHES
ncbi:hypothetical protein EXIGLDRAFT_843325 [Exidia glandulosa HHB12029]|uniref:AAA-ATPase-like domain-containing protein n=1 Tax=Exidia glandulosa HHB12029 TaxID=1314781 RepID=A0A165CRB2_EXIGL|nr:hypothetical protein EXIGLDRAFT_843325 [Exidia glandulosa HHB12029]